MSLYLNILIYIIIPILNITKMNPTATFQTSIGTNPAFNSLGNTATTSNPIPTSGTTSTPFPTGSQNFFNKAVTGNTGNTTSTSFLQGNASTNIGFNPQNKPLTQTNVFPGTSLGMTSQPLSSQVGAYNIGGNFNMTTNMTTQPILTLLPNNMLKYEKISQMGDEMKKLVNKIELDIRNNDIYLDYAETLLKGLQENFKIIKNEGVKVVKFCKLIYSKNTKIKFILQNLKNEMRQQNDFLDKERKNYNILEHHPSMKIAIPDEYLLTLAQEIEEKIALHVQQISDLEALVNLYYRKEYGTFKVNSDLVEELIKELYNCLLVLVSDAARINEYVVIIKNSFIELMKYYYNWNDYEIDNRFRGYLSAVDEGDKIATRERSMKFA